MIPSNSQERTDSRDSLESTGDPSTSADPGCIVVEIMRDLRIGACDEIGEEGGGGEEPDCLLEGPTFDGIRQNEKLWEWY